MAYLPLSISVSIGSIPKIFGVGLVQHWKEIFFVSEISADLQKRPYGVKGVSHRAKNGQKVLVKFDTKLLKNRNRANKTRTRVSEDFLRPKVTTPSNFGVGKNFCGSGCIFENFELLDFFQKHFYSLFTILFFQFFSQKLSKSEGQ